MTLKLSTLSILLGLGVGLPQIYGIVKPAAFAAAVIVLALSATIAAWIPARHAAAIDPVIALRAN